MERRSFLKTAGVVGVGGAVSGCLGIGGNDGREDPIVLSTFPTNMPQLEYLEQEGILEEEMSDAGYEYEVQWTFEGPSQFAAGQSDIAVNLSTIDAARMAAERDIDIAIAGKLMTMFNGVVARSDSPYAPSQAGDIQAAVDNLAEDGERFGIFGWSSGHIPADQIVIEELLGHTFQPDDSSFPVQSSNPGALAQLLMDGDLAMAANAPTQGIAGALYEGNAEVLWYGSDLLDQEDFGIAPLINTVVRPQLVEDHSEAIAAWHRAWQRGNEWFFEDAIDDIPGNEDLMGQYNTEDPELAEYITRWLIDEGDDIPGSFESDLPRHWETAEMTDEWLAGNHEFMDNAAEAGQAPENWDELISYEHVEI